jgi:predicted adenine nucleotide alpha hydrolase (AANH) superfamily ATPase
MYNYRMNDVRRILLHVCCAPCSTSSAERLQSEGWDVELFFFNPNVFPPIEHARRLSSAQEAARMMGLPLHEDLTSLAMWKRAVRPFGGEPEGGRRCEECFRFRMDRTAEAASRLGIGRFTTTLSVSPHKDFGGLVAAGRAVAERSGVSFVEENFKKRSGFSRSVEMSRDMGLYRQDYCGCFQSLLERDRRRGYSGI